MFNDNKDIVVIFLKKERLMLIKSNRIYFPYYFYKPNKFNSKLDFH